MRIRSRIAVAIVAVAGCSIESAGLRPDTSPEIDAAVDAAAADVSVVPDAPRLDAGHDAGSDAGDLPRDAGEAPDGGTSECEGEASMCSADGTELLGCADGRVTRLACVAGCDRGTSACRDIPSCGLVVAGDLAPGADELFTLCGEGNDASPRSSSGCSAGADGEDRMYRIVLDRPRMVRIDLRDADGTEAIDTVVHVRTYCEDADSQVACHDDIDCRLADPDFDCSGSVELRQSRIEMELGPGAYWIVADSINQGGWRCGTVRLRYTWL